MSIESGLEGVKDREAIRNEFKQRLRDWLRDKHEWKHKYRQYSGQEFYSTALSSLQSKHSLNTRAAAALLEQSGKEELDAEIDRRLDDIKNQSLQQQMYFQLVNNVQDYFAGLGKYHFVSTSPTGLTALAKGRLGAYDRTTLTKLIEKMTVMSTNLETAKTGSFEDKRHCLRAQLLLSFEIYDEFEKIGKDLDAAVNNAAEMVDEQAIYNFFVDAKEDEKQEFVGTVTTGAKFVTDVGGSFAPPGHKWIAGLVNFVIEAGGRTAEEVLIMRKVAEYRDQNATGSIFEEYSKNPALMAQGLAKTLNKNVELLLAGISVIGEEIPGWKYIEKLIKSVISEWMKRRIEEARKLLPQEKLTKEEIESFEKDAELRGAATAFEGMYGLVLAKFREDAEKDLGEALLDKLKDGETWATGVKFLVQEGDELKETGKDFGTNFGAILVEPIVTRVMKIIPVSPAQLVSGDDLTALVSDAKTSIGVPGGWGKISVATDSGQSRTEHDKGELFRNRYGWKVRGSNVARALTDANGKVTKQWVAFRRFGSLIWGYLDADGTFDPETPEITDEPWGQRRITNDGYVNAGDPGSNRSGGTWFEVEELMAYFVLQRDDQSYEWLRKITMTSGGRAEEVVNSSVTRSMFG